MIIKPCKLKYRLDEIFDPVKIKKSMTTPKTNQNKNLIYLRKMSILDEDI